MTPFRKAVATTTVAILVLAHPLPAAADKKPGDGHDDGKPAGQGSPSTAKAYGSVKEAWTMLSQRVAAIDKLLAVKQIAEIGAMGDDLESVFITLKEKSDMVAPEKKANATSAVKQLDKALDSIHEAAEAKDADRIAGELKKVTALMPVIEGLYPAGALK